MEVLHTKFYPDASIASANFSLNNFSASVHTRAVFLSGNSSSDGKRSELNCSDASRGSNVGKWSIDITDKGGLPGLKRRIRRHVLAKKPDQNPPYIDRYRWCRERCVDVVNWNWIEGVRGVATDIDNHTELPLRPGCNHLFLRDKRRDFGCEINAVDKNIDIQDLLEWTTLCRLREIPLKDVVPKNS